MRCDQVMELVQSELGGVTNPIELGGRLPVEVHRHLQGCASCRALTHELALLEMRLQRLDEAPPAPDDTVVRVLATVRRRGREAPVPAVVEGFPWGACAALVAVFLGVGVHLVAQQGWLAGLVTPVQAWLGWFWSSLASVPFAVSFAVPQLPALAPSLVNLSVLAVMAAGVGLLNWRWMGTRHG